MNWSRKWKIYDCRKCLYHGVPTNAKNICVTSGDCTARKNGREGQRYVSIIPNDNLYKNCIDSNCRSRKKIIKSGLMPNNNESVYSYGYNNYLKNKRKMTYDMKVATSKPITNNNSTKGYGGFCNNNKKMCENITYQKMANAKFFKNSAVSSSSRLDRLKLDTIKGSKRCKNNNAICNGVYPNAANRKHGYKDIYNENHPEVNCPQYSARHRSIGNMNRSIGC